MLYLPLAPEPPLGELVETLFVLKGYQPEHEIERVIPDASCSLVIELDDQRRWVADNDTHQPIQECRRSWVSGPFQRHFSISARSDTELLAVRFRPGGIHPLLRSPVSEIRDRVVDASQLLGNDIADLRSTLLGIDAPEAQLATTETWLRDRADLSLALPLRIRAAIEAIQSDPTVSTLKIVIEQTGYSRKQFIQLFKKHVGLRPKSFQRICRFSRALETIQQRKRLSWAALSADCGYSDQSHFIRNFKEFSGFNPTQFLSTGTDRANFFPIEPGDPDDR